MKRTFMMFSLAALLLSGCSVIPGEDRAFVVVLCIDASDDGWKIAARVPSYQDDGGYLTLQAGGISLNEALSAMEIASPMRLHYGQLRMMVIGADLAQSGKMKEAINTVAEMLEFRQEAVLATTFEDITEICDGMKPITGTRLSKSLDALIAERCRKGVVINTTVSESRQLADRQGLVMPLLLLANDTVQLDGVVLYNADYALSGILSGRETQLLGVLSGRIRQVDLLLDERVLRIKQAASSIIYRSPNQVDIRLTLDCNAKGAAEEIAARVYRLTERLMQAGCDTFGIARQAVRHDSTEAAWEQTDWPAVYRSLQWQLYLDIR